MQYINFCLILKGLSNEIFHICWMIWMGIQFLVRCIHRMPEWKYSARNVGRLAINWIRMVLKIVFLQIWKKKIMKESASCWWMLLPIVHSETHVTIQHNILFIYQFIIRFRLLYAYYSGSLLLFERIENNQSTVKKGTHNWGTKKEMMKNNWFVCSFIY